MEKVNPFSDEELKIMEDIIPPLYEIEALKNLGKAMLGRYPGINYRRFLDAIAGLKAESARYRTALEKLQAKLEAWAKKRTTFTKQDINDALTFIGEAEDILTKHSSPRQQFRGSGND